MAEKGRVLTGARARLMANGKKVGYVTQYSVSEELTYEPVEVLDNIETEELVPTGYRVSGSVGTVRLVGETLKSAGYFPSAGKNPETHLLNILQQADLTLALEDSKTKRTVALVEGLKFGGNNLNVSARGITGNDVSFTAIRLKDESELT